MKLDFVVRESLYILGTVAGILGLALWLAILFAHCGATAGIG